MPCYFSDLMCLQNGYENDSGKKFVAMYAYIINLYKYTCLNFAT